MAFAADGQMYGVEYTCGNRLFRVSANGEQVDFVAGAFHASNPRDAFPPDAATAVADVRFHGLHDVAVGRDGIVYVADTFNHRIRRFDPLRDNDRVIVGGALP